MIKFNEIDNMKQKYKNYSYYWFDEIQRKGLKLGDDIKLKLQHGLTMSDAVANTTKESGFFNESYVMSGAVDGLLHDVGRFPQYFESGTLKDAVTLGTVTDDSEWSRIKDLLRELSKNE